MEPLHIMHQARALLFSHFTLQIENEVEKISHSCLDFHGLQCVSLSLYNLWGYINNEINLYQRGALS